MLHGRSAFGLKIPTIGLGQAAVKESAVWQSSGGDEWLTDDCIVSPSFDGLNKCAKFTWREKRWRSGSKISTNTPDLTVSMWLCEMWHSISLKCKLDVLKCVVINREIHFKFWLMPIFHLSRCCGYCCFLAERLNTFNEVYLHNDYWGFFPPYCVYFFHSRIKLRYVTDCRSIRIVISDASCSEAPLIRFAPPKLLRFLIPPRFTAVP